MLSDKIPFTKSIRFKWTLIYSLITFFFSAFVVFSLNYSINSYFRNRDSFGRNSVSSHMQQKQRLTDEQRNLLQEARLVDLREIQHQSLNSLIPLALFSFVIGYVLSGNITKPLISMQRRIDKLTDQDLGLQLNIPGDDEIAKLGKSFDQMSLRLKDSFDSQTRFIQDASHELKTPLAIIQSNLEELIDSKTVKNEDALESINTAVVGVKRMNLLTESLLDLSNSTKFDIKKVDINKIISEQIKQLEVVAQKAKVKIKFKNKSNQFVDADETALTQMIFNLLDNAIKYSSEKRDSKIEISIESNRKQVELIVKDNGIGIPKKKQSKIFDRFYQVDASRNSKKNGLGLGLSIVKSIVDKHRWQISVESSIKGSTFVVKFKDTI